MLNPKKQLNFIHSKFFLTMVYVSFVMIFINIFYFFDSFNLEGFFNASSYLYLSQNPYLFWPNQFPPNFFSFLLPTFISFLFSEENIFASIEVLKVIQMIFSIGTAFLIYKLVMHFTQNNKSAKIAFIAYLFSPIIFYVNFIQLEQTPIGIFFTVLAIYIILAYENDDNRKFIVLIIGSIFLFYAIYLYLLPLVLIPPFLIYQKSIRNFIKIVIAFMVGFLFFYIPYTIHGMFNFLISTGAIATVGSSGVGYTIAGLLGPHMYPADSFQLLLKSMFTLFFIPSIFIVPILLRLCHRNNIFTAFTINFILIFILVTINNLDEFSFVIPFLIVLLAWIYNENNILLKLFLIQMYDIPFVILFLINGNIFYLDGTGIFYLSYLQFHLNINFNEYSWASIASKVLIFSGFITFVYLIFIIFKNSKTPRKVSSFISIANHKRFKVNMSSLNYNHIKSYISFKKIQAIILKWKKFIFHSTGRSNVILTAVILLLFIFSIVNVSGPQQAIDSSSSSNPYGIFFSPLLMSNETTFKFVNDYRSVCFYKTNQKLDFPPYSTVAFSRNVSGENFMSNISVVPCRTTDVPYNVTVLSVSNLSASLVSPLTIPKNDISIIPNIKENVSAQSSNQVLLNDEANVDIYNFNGTSVLQYHIHSSQLNQSGVYFLYHAEKVTWVDEIMFLRYGNLLVQLYDPPNSSTNTFLSYSEGTNWIPLDEFSTDNYWNYVNLRILDGKLSISINSGINVLVPYSITKTQSNFTVAIGKDFTYRVYNFKNAFVGSATTLFSNGNLSFNSSLLAITTHNIHTSFNKTVYTPYKKLNILIRKNTSLFSILSNGMCVSSMFNNSILKFGRLSFSPIPVIFTINKLSISSKRSSFLINVIDDSIVVPSVLILVVVLLFRKNEYKTRRGIDEN